MTSAGAVIERKRCAPLGFVHAEGRYLHDLHALPYFTVQRAMGQITVLVRWSALLRIA